MCRAIPNLDLGTMEVSCQLYTPTALLARKKKPLEPTDSVLDLAPVWSSYVRQDEVLCTLPTNKP